MTSIADIAKDQAALETYLSTRSYVTGFNHTQDDATLIGLVGSPDAKKNPHTFRWAKHINAFTAEERKAWPAGKGSVTLDAKKSPASGAANKSRSKSPAKTGGDKSPAKGSGDKSPAKGGKIASPAQKKAAPPPKVEDEEDDLFGSDDEEDRKREEMLKAKVAAARAGKPEKEKPKQRSLIKLEIKPNEVETDLNAMALKIKAEVVHPGIQNWGDQHKLEPVAYGIYKLLINVVVWDDDIMVEDIEELLMEKFADDIQSIDVAAMSKV